MQAFLMVAMTVQQIFIGLQMMFYQVQDKHYIYTTKIINILELQKLLDNFLFLVHALRHKEKSFIIHSSAVMIVSIVLIQSAMQHSITQQVAALQMK